MFYFLGEAQSSSSKLTIEGIKNDQDFSRFVLENFDKEFMPLLENKEGYKNPMCSRIVDSLKIPNWFKSDLNNDGLIDLFFTDFNLPQLKICVFNFGDNNYKSETFPINMSIECVFVKPVRNQNLNLLELYYQVGNSQNIDRRLIVYRYNKFIEFNPYPNGNKINYVSFDMLDINDKSIAFSLMVDRNGMIELKYYDFEGHLKTRKEAIKDKELENMLELADYADIMAINYDYSHFSEEYYSGKLVFGYGLKSTKEIKFYKGMFEQFILREMIGYFFRKKFELIN